MKKRAFNALVALSLALFVATCVMWARSYWQSDQWSWRTRTGRAGVDSLRGRVIVGRVIVTPAVLANIPRWRIVQSIPADAAEATSLKPGWSFATFQAARSITTGLTAEDVRIPYWFLAMLACVLPAWWWRRRLQEERIRLRGCCPVCGYDLRASPERCPECGMSRDLRVLPVV